MAQQHSASASQSASPAPSSPGSSSAASASGDNAATLPAHHLSAPSTATGTGSRGSNGQRMAPAGIQNSSLMTARRQRQRQHRHHTSTSKVGSSITDSAGSTEDEGDGDGDAEGGANSDRKHDGEGDTDNDNDEEGPVIHYPALATPTASKASFWPFGTTKDPANGASGMIDGPDYRQRSGSAAIVRGGRAHASRSSEAQHTASSGMLDTHQSGPGNGSSNGDMDHIYSVGSRSNAANLPHEILLKVLSNVRSHSDLVSSLLVCKSWCQCGVELLWNKPSFPSVQPLIKMLVVLHRNATNTFPYSSFIKRLNFSSLADRMSDALIMKLSVCDRLERLTLAGCSDIGDASMTELVKTCKNLIALDISDCAKITDETLRAVARECPKLQGLNLSGCKGVGDAGLKAIAAGCPKLRRVKLRTLDQLTDEAIMALAAGCPLLLEVDLFSCAITDRTLWGLFRNSSHLREFSLSGCKSVTGYAFPQREGSLLLLRGADDPLLAGRKPLNSKYQSSSLAAAAKKAAGHLEAAGVGGSGALQVMTPLSNRMFEHVRYLDMTGLVHMTDAAVEGVVSTMPHIRNLVLAKCTNLTDDSLMSVCKLGRHIHFLHLGHVSNITDKAVRALAKSCTRLRYIDLACCPNLTDLSVLELAQNLPRLKRIGLVRVLNLTDQAIHELAQRSTLERIHLSYCENVSVPAVHYLLSKLGRLNHLSLTGVPAFQRADLQHFCRPPPKDFTMEQRSTFCVYSGKGVTELRRHLVNLQHREAMESLMQTPRAHVTASQLAGLGLPLQAQQLFAQMQTGQALTGHPAQHQLAPGHLVMGQIPLQHQHQHQQMQMQGYAQPGPPAAYDENDDDADESGYEDEDDEGGPALQPVAAPPVVPAAYHDHVHQHGTCHNQSCTQWALPGSSPGQTMYLPHLHAPAPQGVASTSASLLQQYPQAASGSGTASPAWTTWLPPVFQQQQQPLSPVSPSANVATSSIWTSGAPAQASTSLPAGQGVGSSSGSHYLNTAAFASLVSPGIARAAREQDEYERASRESALRSGTARTDAGAVAAAATSGSGADADGDQRMRSASVDIELEQRQQQQRAQTHAEAERRSSSTRPRRDTIRQNNFRMDHE